MTGISILKTLDKLDLVKSDSKDSSSDSNSKTSGSFDDYLKNYSSNNAMDSNSNKVNSDKNSNKDEDQDKNDSEESLKNTLNSSSDKEVASKQVQDSKETNKSVEEKKPSDKDVDVKSLASVILGCYNGNSIDLNKLKSELKNLKISEDFQKDIMQFVSKLQDSLKGKDINSYFKLLVSAQNDLTSKSKGHSELINAIVDVLKSKLTKESSSSKAEVNVDSKHSNSLHKAEDLDSKTFIQNPKSEVPTVKTDGKAFKEDLKENTNKDKKSNYDSSKNSYNSSDKLSTSKSKETISETLKEDNGDDKFLKNFVSDDKNTKDNQISKVTTFMNQFSKVNSNAENIKLENPVINKATFAQDIVKSVKFMESNNLKELTVKINPKELGEVVIKLSMENNIMKANISTANKETYTLLHSSLADMNSNLNNHDIKIQAFSVNIYDDTTYFSGQGNSHDKSSNGDKKEERHSTSKNAAVDNVTDADDAAVENGNINILI
jgi:flagellar hook-length control protein FliK